MAKDNSQGFKWRNTVAGCTAGFIPVLALHPLDVVKTRLQVQDGVRGALPLYRGVADAVGSIVRQEGWRSLYAGLTPALIGAGASWGVFFSAYNRARSRYQRRTGSAQLSPAVNLAAAAEAGALVSFVTNPIWVVKTRLELQRGVRSASAAAATAAHGAAASAGHSVRQALPPYRGMVDAVKQIAREEGLAGFYRGLGPSLLLVSHGAIQLMVYEELKSLAVHRGGTAAEQKAQRAHVAAWRRQQQEDGSSGSGGSGNAVGEAEGPWGFRRRDAEDAAARGGPPLRKPSNAEVLGMGALSKLAASVLTYPPQVVRSRLQQRMARRAIRYRSGLDVLRITLRREGVGGLYKGLLPNVLRVMPQSALTFLVYETVMKLLEEQPRELASGD